jgi:beta-lactamase class A
MLDAEFDPATSRMGAAFLMDLQTGEAFTFGNDIAFSGMSLTKIAIMTRWYLDREAPANNDEAVTLAEAMICSENISTNELLADIGGGNPFTGAIEVTNFLQDLGIANTFLTAPYANDPFITPQPAIIPQTNADQRRAEPDPYNQATVDELGGFLASLYECAYESSGALIETFPDRITPRECRQVLRAMSDNRIDALFESGVPRGTRIAHKHGWISDTHGDAGIIFTPGGDFALVTIVHNPVWMDANESFPLMAEISRAAWNYYNPDDPVDEIRFGVGVEECHLLGNPLIQELQSSTFDE